MFCIKCGNQMPDAARFCAVCGTPVDGSEPRSAVSDPVGPASTPAIGEARRPSAAENQKTLEYLTLGPAIALIVVEGLTWMSGDVFGAILTLFLALGAAWAYQLIKTGRSESAKTICLIVGALCALAALYDLLAIGPTDALAFLVAGGCAAALLYAYTRLPLTT